MGKVLRNNFTRLNRETFVRAFSRRSCVHRIERSRDVRSIVIGVARSGMKLLNRGRWQHELGKLHALVAVSRIFVRSLAPCRLKDAYLPFEFSNKLSVMNTLCKRRIALWNTAAVQIAVVCFTRAQDHRCDRGEWIFQSLVSSRRGKRCANDVHKATATCHVNPNCANKCDTPCVTKTVTINC